ncbi:methyltransferase domain-containing protein [bacterium AH-315-P15]|nr:methyltransferase domain-containing protein [bacterium AH-315-P15]
MVWRNFYRSLFPDKSQVDFPSGFIPAQYVISGAGHVRKSGVVIGDLSGRDYFGLKEIFEAVTVIDIVDNGTIERKDLLLQDASKPTNIAEGSVDYIVICNVLEHMYGDMACLLEMNRILKPTGRLFVDTPYFSDTPFFHYRIYSPRVFRRMLKNAGFEVVSASYRGFVVGIRNSVFAVLAIALYPILGKRAAQAANLMFCSIHRLLSRSYMINRLSRDHFGEYLVCRKISAGEDELAIQVNHFGGNSDLQE